MSCGCSNFVDDNYDEFFGLFNRGRRRRRGGVSSTKPAPMVKPKPMMACDCEECARQNAIKPFQIDTLLEPKGLVANIKDRMEDRREERRDRREERRSRRKGRPNGLSSFVEEDDFMVHDEPTFNMDAYSDIEDYDGGGSVMDMGVDDIENGDSYDNFLTKKMRERRRVKKEAMEGGLTRKEAKQVALEQVPRTTLKELIAKIKSGQSVNNAGGVDLTGLSNEEKADMINQALNMGSNTSDPSQTTMDLDADTDAQNVQAGFFGENKNTMIILGLGILAVGGYFAWKKFGNKGK